MKGFCPLASGSKGNSLFFGSNDSKLLIDAGLSCRNLKSRLEEIGIDLAEIDAILITHEHSDHIRGLEKIVKDYNIPILCNSDTAKMILDSMDERPKFKIFTTGETFVWRDLKVHPFSIQHDTVDPVAFIIETEGLKFGMCTDLGFITSLVKEKLRECDYLVIEANHEVDLVHASRRPPMYKERVLGRQGHLSNEECGKLLVEIYHDKLKQVFLAHLSEECNQPDIALTKVADILGEKGLELKLSIAHQEKVSEKVVFETQATLPN
ncbi:MAG: MBL fold metallo-hydrolase [Rhabdochlamydiaceae bacterium]|nr:MBL fold metallo-hydrolase [Candidatus Amphrikana amoebophyrae]